MRDDTHPFSHEPERRRGRGKGHLRSRSSTDEDAQHRQGHRGPGGPGGEDRGGHRGGRGRAQRGDVRTAILLLLAGQPMHGYQIMQAIGDRTNGAWQPSPGAVYPTIEQLADEGLATVEQQGGRRLVTLTAKGRDYVAENGAELGDPFVGGSTDGSGPDLRDSMHQLQVAARQVAVSGSTTQIEAAARVLAQAQRSLYLVLAGEPDGVDG